MLESLHKDLPDARISILVRKGNESLFDNHPHLHQVLIWDKTIGKYSSLFKMARQVRSNNYDWVINAHRFASSGFIAWRSGAETISGFDKNPFSFAHSSTIKHGFEGQHETERNHKLLQSVRTSTKTKPRLYPSKNDFAHVTAFQQKPYYTIAPTSVWFTKQWSPSKWIELIDSIPAESEVILLGAKSDKEACNSIVNGASRTVQNAAGSLTLLQSAALMSGAKMNYVNDSAPMHLCSAMNAPVTAIYCSTVPKFGFGPLSDVSHIVETKESLNCKPCGIHGYQSCPKGHFKCGETIDVSSIPQ